MRKKSIKQIILFTIGHIDHASSRIRGIQYIPYFEQIGYQINWVPRIAHKPKSKWQKYFVNPIQKRRNTILRAWLLLFANPEYFFIQKIFVPQFLLKVAKRKTTKLIFDFDDAIYLDNSNPLAQKKTQLMIQNADYIIVSNQLLYQYCQSLNRTAIIITSPIDTDRIFPDKKVQNTIPTIGWIGSNWTTKYLKIVKEPLQQLAKQTNFRLLLVGANKQFTIENVQVDHLDWSFDKENEHLNQMDIGIMPLTEDEYSTAKGGYKLLMYMSAGLPMVASPVGINIEIVKQDVNGFLASTSEEWYNYLKILIDNQALRNGLGQQARQEAEQKYSREICFEVMKEIMY